jgi:hypothetical protein
MVGEVPLLIQPQRKVYGKASGISLEIFLVERKVLLVGIM